MKAYITKEMGDNINWKLVEVATTNELARNKYKVDGKDLNGKENKMVVSGSIVASMTKASNKGVSFLVQARVVVDLEEALGLRKQDYEDGAITTFSCYPWFITTRDLKFAEDFHLLLDLCWCRSYKLNEFETKRMLTMLSFCFY